MKFTLLIAVLVAFTASAAENLIKPSGFENWGKEKNLPADNWRWSVKGNFAVIKQDSEVRHSGKYSLHLKDTDTGNSNESVCYHLSREETKRAAGKLLRFTAYAKQAFASRHGVVGIALWIRGEDGKISKLHQGIDGTGETGWQPLSIRLPVPKNARQIQAVIQCANGWRNTGEGWFDDLELVIEDPANPSILPVAERTDNAQVVLSAATPEEVFLPLLPRTPKLWTLRSWGGLRLRVPVSDERTVFDSREAKPYSGFAVRTEMLEYRYNFIKSGSDHLWWRMESNFNGTVNVIFENSSGNKTSPAKVNAVDTGTGRYRYEFSLVEVEPKEILTNIRQFTVNFPEPTGYDNITIFEMAVICDLPDRSPQYAVSPEAERYRTKYRASLPVFEEDGKPRPEIHNGTWYMDGQPVFYLGPWLYSRTENNWNPNANPLGVKHIAYNEPPSKKVFREVGFNSAQISAAISFPGAARFGAPLPERIIGQEQRSREYFERFGSMPMVVDFAFGFNKLIGQGNPELYRELKQRNGNWHAFIPFCPEHPEGARYYRDFMLGGTVATLEAGGNPMVWELFNESSYNCQCRFNTAAFSVEMAKQYGTIAAANQVWQTVFASFDELKGITHFEQYRGLWPDWCKFSARRYAELLKHYREVVRSVDRRSRVYFAEQLSKGFIKAVGATMDYRLTAEVLDVLGTESGWRYGGDFGGESGNEMEAAATGTNLSYSFICDFFRAISKDRKPVMNHEYYCGRFEFGERIPSRSADFITGMWGEVFHGVSGSYHYVWDKRAVEWKTFEQAKANVIKGGFKAFSMLNPYNWPPEELDGGKRFMEELEPYRERVLPIPRTGAPQVAIFFSYPTLRMQGMNRENYVDKMLNWYSALLYGNYPLQVVFEEELAAGLPASVKALLIPAATHVVPSMLEDLRRFTANGGMIVADNLAFRFDEYSHPAPAIDFPVTRLNADAPASISAVRQELEKNNIFRPVVASPADGGVRFTEMELHLIDRGDFKLAFLVNLGERRPRLVKLQFHFEDDGEFFVFDSVNKRLLVNSGKESWNREELKHGLTIAIPPQERFLLAFERNRPKAESVAGQEDILELHRKLRETYREELELLQKRKVDSIRQEEVARFYLDVNTAECIPLDLRGVVNMAFQDKIADDGKGGWFDQGDNDFAAMPLGKITAAGVPFEIIDPKTNAERSALILGGIPRPYFPDKATGIKVGMQVKNLYFLHTMGWSAKNGETILIYRIVYQDNTSIEIPVRNRHEIGGWWGTPVLSNAKIAVEAANPHRSVINLQCFKWSNPHLEKEIRSLDIISAKGSGIPAVVAVTAELNTP